MAGNGRVSYQFNGFSFDTVPLRLLFGGEPIDVPPKSLEVLGYLIEHRDRAVPREELLDRLWGESIVEEASLTVAVSRLRKALLALDKENTYVQTLPRLGYRFVAEANEVHFAAPEAVEVTETTLPTETATRQSTFAKVGIGLAAAAIIIAVVGIWTSRSGDLGSSGGDIAAQHAFRKGEQLMGARLVSESIPYFQETVARDPDFALGYAKLAAAYAMLGSPDESDRYSKRALELDPGLAEAHAVDGFIKMLRDWDWSGAEQSLRHSLSIDPSSAMAHHWLGTYLSIRGRLIEARAEMLRAIEIAPETPIYHADLCQVYYFTRDFEKAVDSCNRALELDPSSFLALGYLSAISSVTGNEKKVVEYDLAILDLLSTDATSSRSILREQGHRAYVRAELERRLALAKKTGVTDSPFVLAHLYLGLGDAEKAIMYLQDEFARPRGIRSFNLVYLGVDPRYDPLRTDPRFAAILQQMGLAG